MSVARIDHLRERARPGRPDAADALAVYADYLQEHGDPLGETLARALTDPELGVVGLDRFCCPNDVEGERAFDVPVFRFGPFGRAINLASDTRAVDTELVLPPTGEPFLISRTAVSQRVYEATNGRHGMLSWVGPLQPAHNIGWLPAARWLAAMSLRSPTNAEWELACRAGTATAFCFGDRITPGQVNFEENPTRGTVDVGSLPPNAFGLYEVHGNVWELAHTADESPEVRSVRGGQYDTAAESCRSGWIAGGEWSSGALRPVRSLPETA